MGDFKLIWNFHSFLFLLKGKRPTSSMCPVVFTDKDGEVRLITGAAGGSMISTATAWVAIQNLWFGRDIKEAIDSKRLHHQLYPMTLQYESGFDQVRKIITNV